MSLHMFLLSLIQGNTYIVLCSYLAEPLGNYWTEGVRLSLCLCVCICESVRDNFKVALRCQFPIHCNTTLYEGRYPPPPPRYVAKENWHSPSTITTSIRDAFDYRGKASEGTYQILSMTRSTPKLLSWQHFLYPQIPWNAIYTWIIVRLL